MLTTLYQQAINIMYDGLRLSSSDLHRQLMMSGNSNSASVNSSVRNDTDNAGNSSSSSTSSSNSSSTSSSNSSSTSSSNNNSSSNINNSNSNKTTAVFDAYSVVIKTITVWNAILQSYNRKVDNNNNSSSRREMMINSKQNITVTTSATKSTTITTPTDVSCTTSNVHKQHQQYQHQQYEKMIAMETNIIHMSLQRVIQLLYNLLSRILPLLSITNTTTTITNNSDNSSNNTYQQHISNNQYINHQHQQLSTITISKDTILPLLLQLLATVIPLHASQFLSYWPLFLSDSYNNNQQLVDTCNTIADSITNISDDHHHSNNNDNSSDGKMLKIAIKVIIYNSLQQFLSY